MRDRNQVGVTQIERAVLATSSYLDQHERSDTSWLDLSEEKLWHMLVSCILGSRVTTESAEAFTERVRLKGLLEIPDILRNAERIERELVITLSRPFRSGLSHQSAGGRYRYPRSRSRYIIATAQTLYGEDGSGLKNLLASAQDEYHARRLVERKATGVGYKQASLFLRNASYARNLAILDSHVLKFMTLVGLLDCFASDPRSGFSPGQYSKVESRLFAYAMENGVSLSSLDLAVWIVMRVVFRKFRICP